MRDPIHLCDVVIYDGKARKEHKVRDIVLSGNDKRLIWNSPYHRNRIIKEAFRTKAKIKRQKENLSLNIRDIDFKVSLGYSNHNWGLTK